jgi:hypothetical protein
MPSVETLTATPNADVPRIVLQYKAIGATVVVTPNPDGVTSTIVATIP